MAKEHKRWPGCAGDACGECACRQYEAPDRYTLTLPGLDAPINLDPRSERSLSDAELRQATAELAEGFLDAMAGEVKP